MKCLICKTGVIKAGQTTVTLERGNSIIVIKGVPADICMQCGEYYLTEDVSRRLYELADRAAKSEAELGILQYAA